MKKLLFAIAGAASFAALAADPAVGDNITVLGFENFTSTDVGVVNKDDSGGNDTSYWSVPAGAEDNSLVKAYGVGENATAPTGISFPAPFTDAGDKYLALDTNGTELQRKINADGSAQAISSDPLYIDTLVQFTPSESAPSVETDLVGAKLAIWLGVDSTVTPNTTNLYVQGYQYSGSEIDVQAPLAYKITNIVVQAGTWYRLTVKAVPAALSKASMVSAFMVAIDGTDAVAEQCVLASDAFATAEGDVALGESGYILTADDMALISANKVFGSMADLTVTGLTSVGFKGTGALDDFVVTTAAPEFGGNDYVVSIDGSDVVVTPSAADLAAVQAAVIAGGGTLDVTDVAAVNAALAAPIGTTGIPSWQALFLGLPPTEVGLESFKIDSISIGADGKVTVALPDDVDPKTGRGVTITLKLKAADTPNAAPADWTDVESADGTTFAPFAPGSTDTKKFYKVVVEFAGSSASASQE